MSQIIRFLFLKLIFVSALLPFDFPKDHSFHNEFNVEWVYFVGQVESSDGKKFGFELSFFKGKLTDEIEVFPVHFAISDLDNKIHYTAQTIQRGFGNLARFDKTGIRSGDFSLKILDKTKFLINANPRNKKISLQLELSSEPDQILLQGKNGFSTKSRKFPEYNSNYYSIPNLKPRGKLVLNEKTYEIISGYTWMDHEWSKSNKNSSLSSNEVSWDWFGINFEDGSSLMCFNFRKNKSSEPESFGTYINSKKEKFYFEKENQIKIKSLENFWKSKNSKIKYQLSWQIEFLDFKILVEPIFSEQEFIALETTGNVYWEGAIKSSLTKIDKKISGKGYMELKGY